MAKQWPPPGYRVLEGFQELTEEWGLTLPDPMCRRVEDESLVFWRPGLTAWINAWGEGEEDESRKRRLKGLKKEVDPDARVLFEKDDGEVIRFAYRVEDVTPDGPVDSVAGFAVVKNGHLQISIYFDDPTDAEKAASMIESIRFAGI
jgi:hypothetical protein